MVVIVAAVGVVVVLVSEKSADSLSIIVVLIRVSI